MSEAIQTESPEVHPLEFEPIPREKITIWRGREVEAFPHNPFYKSSYSIDFDKILRERPSKKPHPYFCGACRLDLVDFFSHFKVEPLDMACIDYENDWDEELARAKIVTAVFHRTCKNCAKTDNRENIFNGRPLHAYESYSIPIGGIKKDTAS